MFHLPFRHARPKDVHKVKRQERDEGSVDTPVKVTLCLELDGWGLTRAGWHEGLGDLADERAVLFDVYVRACVEFVRERCESFTPPHAHVHTRKGCCEREREREREREKV